MAATEWHRCIQPTSKYSKDHEWVHTDPYGAWMIELELTDPSEAQTLLDHTAYANVAPEAT